MVREILKIYTDNGLTNNPTFHNIELSDYEYKPSRMGMPTLSATLMWERCLNDEWTGREYVELRGERFYIRHTPSSEKNNTDARYKHSIEFNSEFDEILSNVYFEDYVPSGYILGNILTYDKPCSNSSVFTFYGTIQEFSDRLNCAFLKAGVGDSILKTKTNLTTLDVPRGDGFCSMVDPYGDYEQDKSYEFSFENQFLWEAITSAYTTTEIQFKREGRRIIWGAEAKVLSQIFKYGHDNELLKIGMNNANAKVVRSITMLGSSENIPYYYPNETEYGHISVNASAENKTLTDSMIEVINRTQMLAYLNPDTKAILGKYDGKASDDGSAKVLGYWTSFDDDLPKPYQAGDTLKHSQSSRTSGKWHIGFDFRVEKDGHISLDKIIGNIWQSNTTAPTSEANILQSGLTIEALRTSENKFITSQAEKTDSGANLGYLEKGEYYFQFYLKINNKDNARDYGVTTFCKLNSIQIGSYGETKTGYFWEVGDKKYDGEGSLGIRIKGGATDAMIGDSFQWRASGRMPFQERLVPPKYRNTEGFERFYNAYNEPYSEDYASKHKDAYIDPDTQKPYEFINPFIEGAPSEYIYENEDIKPTIEGVRNADGLLMGAIADIAFDVDDNDSLTPESTDDDKNNTLKYEHSFFYIRLNKFNGAYGFDLIKHYSQTDPMTIQMTSGGCNGCKFKVQVVEFEDETGLKYYKNPIQVKADGSIANGSYSDKVNKDNIIESQQDTSTNSIWLCVQKDAETFGVIMPNQEHKYFPKIGDTFNIINIDLPDAYIYAAEKRLEEEGMRYMSDNNEEKFTFDINASRIFFAEHPEILAELDEYSKIRIEYDGKIYELFISSLTINCKDNEPLPEIRIDLTDTIAVGQSFQKRIEERAQSLIANASNLGGGTGGTGGLATSLADRRYLNKMRADRTPHKLSTDTAFEVGEFVSGASGGIFYRDPETGQTYIETDKLKVRMKAIFEELEIAHTSSIGGQQIITPGGGIDISFVEELDDVYRCYFKAKEEDEGAECRFIAGDQVKCQEFNIQAGIYQNASNKYYWRLIVAVNNDESYVDISKSDCDKDSDIPEAGDTIVQLGNRTDKTRQSAIVHSTVDAFAPCVTLFDGINSYSLEEKEVIQYGVDKTKNPPQPFFHCYGSFYYGPKNRSSYLEFDPQLGYLVFKGTLLLQSQVQDDKGNTQALQDYFESLVPDIDKEDIAGIVNEIVDPQLAEMQRQLDGVIETWFGEGEPSLDRNGYPMNQWGATSFEVHAGDLYYDNKTGYAYRFTKEGNDWKWIIITDEAITKALAAAAEAKKEAESKSRIFVDTPFPPYEEGDLWVNATYPKGATRNDAVYYDDILKCKSTRLTGSFDISDWGYASSYPTDIAGYKYIKEALEQSTTISGGLVLTSLIQLGFKSDTSAAWQCWSGINGIPVADASKGYGIAAWYGGDMWDKENDFVENEVRRYAQTLFRFDGSGYLAGGNISWDVNGQMTFGTGIKIGGSTLGGLQSSIESWANYMLDFGKIFIPVDKDGNELTTQDNKPNWAHPDLFAVKVIKGFYSEEFISVKGISSGSGSTVTNMYLSGLLDVSLSGLESGQTLIWNGEKWVNTTLEAGGGGGGGDFGNLYKEPVADFLAYMESLNSVGLTFRDVPSTQSFGSLRPYDLAVDFGTQWSRFFRLMHNRMDGNLRFQGSKDGNPSTAFAPERTLLDSVNYTQYFGNYLSLNGGTMNNTNVVGNLNADLLDGLNDTDFVRTYTSDSTTNDMNEMFGNKTFIGSVLCTSNAPTNNYWYNIIQLAHRNGSGDGPSYVGQIILGMTGNHERMYYRTHRTRAWQTVARLTDNVASASQLATARTIWGQSFNGTGNVDGTLRLQANEGNYCEGIRIKPSGNWSTIVLGGNDLTANNGTSANTWSIHNNNGNFYINKNNSNGQQAPRLWGHANGWTVGNSSRSNYALNAASFICDSWVRTVGATGWYNETYGGGWYMEDTTWIRAHASKAVYTPNIMRADVGLQSYGYITAMSDERLKTAFIPIKLSLAQIATAPSILFKWKKDNRKDYGSIAQYWQKVLPLSVIKDMEGHLALDYGKTALVSVIQVAKEVMSDRRRIEVLEKENKELKRRLELLERA